MPSVERCRPQEPRLPDEDRRLKDLRPLQHTAVWIDDAADAGVGGANEIASFLDRAQTRLLEMLIGRRRLPEPRVVRDRRQELAPRGDEAAHQRRVDDLV